MVASRVIEILPMPPIPGIQLVHINNLELVDHGDFQLIPYAEYVESNNHAHGKDSYNIEKTAEIEFSSEEEEKMKNLQTVGFDERVDDVSELTLGGPFPFYYIWLDRLRNHEQGDEYILLEILGEHCDIKEYCHTVLHNFCYRLITKML